MHLTQFLTMEVTVACNLGEEHKNECPNLNPDRYMNTNKKRPLTDEKVLEIAKAFYNEYGFAGAVAFHYYNEPLMAKNRMFRWIKLIKDAIPQARFVPLLSFPTIEIFINTIPLKMKLHPLPTDPE